jgi:biotin operon repressor
LKTQYDQIGALIKRSKGATAADLIAATMSTAVHKRMSELRERGWTIRKEQVPGKSYHRYYGKEPQGV